MDAQADRPVFCLENACLRALIALRGGWRNWGRGVPCYSDDYASHGLADCLILLAPVTTAPGNKSITTRRASDDDSARTVIRFPLPRSV